MIRRLLHQNCSFCPLPCIWCLFESHAGACILFALLFFTVAICSAVGCWVIKAWLLMLCSFSKAHNSICCCISSHCLSFSEIRDYWQSSLEALDFNKSSERVML